ncbi:RidA family protein [Gryllotalpicola koreensis]|uniref:RidA family protein n=1 Tax=Gryllotalpicola koreensis TaxID=993086 RepID=UPI0031D5AEFD
MAGQSPRFPGATSADGVIATSGIVAPAVLVGEDLAFAQQAQVVLAQLAAVLADAGAGLDDVLRLEAFLADPRDFAAWDRAFCAAWPEAAARPARTTLVAGFAVPGVLVEVQAIAVTGGRAR